MAEHQLPNSSSSHKSDEAKLAVVMVPVPAQGHLNQLLHLSRIIASYQIPIHFVSTPTHNRQAKLRAQGWDPLTNFNLHFHDFTIPFEVPPPDPKDPTKFPSQFASLFASMIHLHEPIHILLRELAKTSRRVVVIVDFYMLWVVRDVSSIPNAESYCFHSSSAFSLYYINGKITGKPVLVHGEPAIDLPPNDCLFTELLWQHIKLQSKSKECNHGNIYNTNRVIEGEFLNLLEDEKVTNANKHWAIGPFNPLSIPEKNSSNKYLEWLDKQKPRSVIFVSFGTTTSFSDEQIRELALGLEASGQNFMWVLREADRADIFVGESRRIGLPEGFEERVEGRGIIVRDWAPQLEILRHPSTGGFMSHCGWNSCIEGISMGVPIVAWPMASEQPLGAYLISKILKNGLIVRECTVRDEIVKSKTVEGAVKRLMATPEGDELRQRAIELGTAVRQSVTKNGATRAELESFIAHITR